MTPWADLFDRAEAYDVTLEDVEETRNRTHNREGSDA